VAGGRFLGVWNRDDGWVGIRRGMEEDGSGWKAVERRRYGPSCLDRAVASDHGSYRHTYARRESEYMCLIRSDCSDIVIVVVPGCSSTYTERTSNI
jgi:hypothetical protein